MKTCFWLVNKIEKLFQLRIIQSNSEGFLFSCCISAHKRKVAIAHENVVGMWELRV